jgi:hypothetical protein
VVFTICALLSVYTRLIELSEDFSLHCQATLG